MKKLIIIVDKSCRAIKDTLTILPLLLEGHHYSINEHRFVADAAITSGFTGAAIVVRVTEQRRVWSGHLRAEG